MCLSAPSLFVCKKNIKYFFKFPYLKNFKDIRWYPIYNKENYTGNNIMTSVQIQQIF